MQYMQHQSGIACRSRVVFLNYEVEGCPRGGEFPWSSLFEKWTTGGIING